MKIEIQFQKKSYREEMVLWKIFIIYTKVIGPQFFFFAISPDFPAIPVGGTRGANDVMHTHETTRQRRVESVLFKRDLILKNLIQYKNCFLVSKGVNTWTLRPPIFSTDARFEKGNFNQTRSSNM